MTPKAVTRYRNSAPTAALGIAAALALLAPANAQELVSDAQLREAGLMQYWHARIPLVEDDRVDTAYRVDDTLYVVSDQGVLYNVKADVGLIRWARNVAAPDSLVFPPSHIWLNDGRGPTLVLTGESLYVFDRYSGEELFRFDGVFSRGTAPVAAGNAIFFGDAEGSARAAMFSDGGVNGLRNLWTVDLGAKLAAPPVLFGEQDVLFATRSGLLVACSAIGKKHRWHFRAGQGVVGKPAVTDAGIFVASENRSVYMINGTNGRQVWRARLGCPLSDGPIAVEDKLLQRCEGSGIRCLAMADGKSLWFNQEALTVSAAFGTKSVLFTRDRHLQVIENADGKVAAQIVVEPADFAVGNTLDDATILLSRDGRMVCARSADVDYLRKEEMEVAVNRLNLPDKDPRAAAKNEPAPENPVRQVEEEPDYFRSRRDRR